MSENQNRRGVFGGAKPAFTVQRFKRTILVALNEEMADELHQVLLVNESAVLDGGDTVADYLYEFNTQLRDALKQQPPARGEKPDEQPQMKAVS